MSGALDCYWRRARLQPVLLCAAPLAAVAFAIGVTETWLARLGTTAVTFGVAAVLISVARDHGLQLQARLWESWGGPPTTTLLLSTSTAPSAHLRHHREHLRRLLPGVEPLSDTRDREDPSGTRQVIERYTTHLRERTRDAATFPIVADANADYGFRRNVLALRRVGIAACVVAIVATSGGIVAVLFGWLERELLPLGAVLLACAGGAAWWWRLDAAWVRVQAERYANALLDAAELLEPVDPPRPQRASR